MRSYRNGFVASGSLLARRLTQLRSTLDSLGSRLRSAVSQAVGETVGVVVRDALQETLDRVAGCLPEPERPPARPQTWNEDDEDLWPDDGWDYDRQEPREHAPHDDSPPQRMATTVSKGLRAAAWWLRGWTGPLGLVSGAVVGVLAGCTVYAAPALAAAGLRLIGSVSQLDLLSDTVQSLAAS